MSRSFTTYSNSCLEIHGSVGGSGGDWGEPEAQTAPQTAPQQAPPRPQTGTQTQEQEQNRNACFAAGTLLHTGTGYKPIEQFRVGDPILSRSEFNPNGALEIEVVEEVFVHTGKVVHLHVNGQVIRTTAEHPFWVQGKGWVAAKDLQIGDLLLSHDGQWVVVEEVYDTGEWEQVYNLRISDYHTYFVGDWERGFSVWAHNTCYYHGTTRAAAANIVAVGINPSEFGARKDFGKGFYTTTILGAGN